MNRQTRILGISGSLRRESYNSAALRAAAVLAPEGAAVETFGLDGIPLFNQDEEMALRNTELTKKILPHHWQAFGAGNIEEIMADYADDAILITTEGTLKGKAQIRSLFERIFDEMFPPASSSLNLAKQVVEGEIAYIL